tara:strand:+ start:125 stop:586 length:462 start_codon:yes stop_codon:yes gene_type:complete
VEKKFWIGEQMKKNELKRMLKPLIKECIKEVIFEEGTLSTIISEVVRGTSSMRPIVETKYREAKPDDNQYKQKKLEEARRRKKKLLDSIGKEAYNGVNLFEGTTAAPAPSTGEARHSPLADIAPNDPGVDISSLFSNRSAALWKTMSRKKNGN